MLRTSSEIHLEEIHARLAEERAKQSVGDLENFVFVQEEGCPFAAIRYLDAETLAKQYQAQYDEVPEKRYASFELKQDIEVLAIKLRCPTITRSNAMQRESMAADVARALERQKKTPAA